MTSKENQEPLYAIPLWDYATPSICSFSKEYFGTFSQIEGFIDDLCLDEPEDNEDIKLAFERFRQGERNVTYSVAYHDHPLLTSVELVAKETLSFSAREWEHENIWNCIYVLRCDGGEIEQIVVKHNNKYHRCVKAVIRNLYYNDEERTDKKWLPLDGMFWGHPCMIRVKTGSDENFELHYALYASEQVYDSKEEALADCGNLEKINWNVFGEDIFGDG